MTRGSSDCLPKSYRRILISESPHVRSPHVFLEESRLGQHFAVSPSSPHAVVMLDHCHSAAVIIVVKQPHRSVGAHSFLCPIPQPVSIVCTDCLSATLTDYSSRHGNTYPCPTRKCISVSILLTAQIFGMHNSQTTHPDTETHFRVRHGNTFPCPSF